MQRRARDFLGVHHAGLDEVFVLAGADVVTLVAFALLDFLHDNGAFHAGVSRQGAQRLFNGALDNVHADLLVAAQLQGFQGGQAAQQGDAASGNNAFFHGRAGGVEGVFHAGFLFLHFRLGGGADVDDGHAAGQLGQALLQFLAVVIGGGFVNLAADLVDTALDVGGLAVAFDDGGVFLVNDDALGAAQVFQPDAFQLDAQVLADELAAAEDGNVLAEGLAAVAEAGGFDGANVDGAAELVDDQGGQRLAFHFLGDDEERLANLGDLLQQGQEVFEAADLLFVDRARRRPPS